MTSDSQFANCKYKESITLRGALLVDLLLVLFLTQKPQE